MRPLKQYPEKELILLLRQGDMPAFDELYHRYIPRLFNFSKTYIKDDQEAEEAIQEIFTRVWEKRKSLDESRSFKSYLFQSINNYFLNYIRDKKNACQFSDIPEGDFCSQEDIIEELTYKELEKTAMSLISDLPKVRQEVFTLSRMEGLSNSEIANRLNLSKRTVEHHIYLSVKFLKGKLIQKETLYSAMLISWWLL